MQTQEGTFKGTYDSNLWYKSWLPEGEVKEWLQAHLPS
jgi:hypothetical protein